MTSWGLFGSYNSISSIFGGTGGSTDGGIGACVRDVLDCLRFGGVVCEDTSLWGGGIFGDGEGLFGIEEEDNEVTEEEEWDGLTDGGGVDVERGLFVFTGETDRWWVCDLSGGAGKEDCVLIEVSFETDDEVWFSFIWFTLAFVELLIPLTGVGICLGRFCLFFRSSVGCDGEEEEMEGESWLLIVCALFSLFESSEEEPDGEVIENLVFAEGDGSGLLFPSFLEASCSAKLKGFTAGDLLERSEGGGKGGGGGGPLDIFDSRVCDDLDELEFLRLNKVSFDSVPFWSSVILFWSSSPKFVSDGIVKISDIFESWVFI